MSMRPQIIKQAHKSLFFHTKNNQNKKPFTQTTYNKIGLRLVCMFDHCS